MHKTGSLLLTYHGPTVLKSDTLAQGTQALGPDAEPHSLCVQSSARQAEDVLQEEQAPELTAG